MTTVTKLPIIPVSPNHDISYKVTNCNCEPNPWHQLQSYQLYLWAQTITSVTKLPIIPVSPNHDISYKVTNCTLWLSVSVCNKIKSSIDVKFKLFMLSSKFSGNGTGQPRKKVSNFLTLDRHQFFSSLKMYF